MTREEYNREYRSLADARDMAVKVNDKKVAQHYRQQISRLYEEHGKDLKDVPTDAEAQLEEREKASYQRLTIAGRNARDAERYRKLKDWLVDKQEGRWIRIGSHYFEKTGPTFDAAVDALPTVDPGMGSDS